MYIYIYIYVDTHTYIYTHITYAYIYIYCKWGLDGNTVYILPIVFQGIDCQTQCLAQAPIPRKINCASAACR